MNHRWSAALGAFALMSCAHDAAIEPKAPRVTAFASELDVLAPSLMDDFGASGVAIALIEDGEIVLERGYGYADRETRTPMTAETRFNTASVSKAFVAWGVMALVENDTLALDEPVFARLTRWRPPSSEFDSAGVTPRRLLSHTAGFNRGTVAIYGPHDALPSVEAALAGDTDGYGDTRLTIAPGSRFNYAGSGYSVLQLLVEERAGVTLSAYLRTQVAAPLGMTHTEFGWDDHADAEASYYSEFGTRLPALRHAEIAAGGLNTTLHDLARFAAAHVASDRAPAGRGVLRPETLALMMQPAENAEAGQRVRWGLGLMLLATPSGRALVGHDGGNPGVSVAVRIDPQTRDGIVVMTNRSWGYQIVNPIVCAWRNWSREGGEAEPCERDAVGLVVQIIATRGMEAGRARLDALRVERNDAFAAQAAGRIAQQLGYEGRAADALIARRWAVEFAPQSAVAHEQLADALLDGGDRAAARRHLEEAVRLDPGNAALRTKLEALR